MRPLSDEDWQAVNAYHDSELPESERNRFNERIRQEPELAKALHDVRDISSSLRRINTAQIQAPQPSYRWHGIFGGALAAGLLLAAVYLFSDRDIRQSPADIHTAFLNQPDPGGRSSELQQASQFQDILPDLTLAGFSLVATRKMPESVAAHYVGRNGCRLTLIAGKGELTPPVDRAVQAAAWQAGGYNYLLLALGMDVTRFQLLAEYLQQSGTNTRLALSRKIQRSGSCA